MNQQSLVTQIEACRLCERWLTPRPVIRVSPSARVLIVGQAPGRRVHETGIPWNDPSGDRLRAWLQLERSLFYDATRIAIVPMGFCYPGKGRTGDLPPRPECYETWHPSLLETMPHLRCMLLVGRYAQRAYLPEARKLSLDETVRRWRDWFPERIPLPHPSPRNRRWLAQRPWFETEVVPAIRSHLHGLLADRS
ncbi:MAG: uracil-DNA glycosylase family protein [Gammaproteobacteria bacterium]|nr:MAG: uracil-DNA glycosylase family protein [Gammaproteobacteria bacterium]